MEDFFLNIGFGWTISKILPYALFLFVGIILFLFIKKKKFRFSKIVSLISIFIPLCIYFALNPIYEGDFANNAVSIRGEEYANLDVGLQVLAIPGCPFCYESIDLLAELKSRTGSNNIQFIVVSNDSSTMDWYKDKSAGRIPVRLVPTESTYTSMTNGEFPTFIYNKGNGECLVWSNENFGTAARDEVEQLLNVKGR